MPVLSNSRHEQYAQRVAAGAVASDAYRELYPRSANWKDKTVWETSSKLTAKVRTRIGELQAVSADRVADTVETLCEQLDDARDEARKNKQSGPMVQAILGKGKLLGLLVDKTQDVGKDGRSLDEMTDEELAAIIRKGKSGNGADSQPGTAGPAQHRNPELLPKLRRVG